MRKLAWLAAALLGSAAAPASAAFTFSLDGVRADGTSTFTRLMSPGCGTSAVCSVTVSPTEVVLFGGTLDGGSSETLDGSFTLRGTNARYIDFVATFTITNGQIGSTFLTATGAQIFGNCPQSCTIQELRASSNNFAVRVFDTTAGTTRLLAPVPEPGTWALMLVGFGMVGSVMRRRDRVAVSYS